MAYLITGADLYADALALAGEPATYSQYADDVYPWLTVVERALVSGGQFGPSVLEPLDWSWARAYPRGALQLTPPVNAEQTLTLNVFEGSATAVVVSPSAVPDLRDYRIADAGIAARHLIVAQQGVTSTLATLTLQSPWTGSSEATTAWVAYPDTYRLPGDFVRGCSPLFVAGLNQVSGPTFLDVIDATELERHYPSSLTQPGIPEAAARVAWDRLRLSHYVDRPVQIEFDYIRRPPLIEAGTIPMVPEAHRRVLSYGAAYLILDDKDDSGAPGLWTRFQSQVKAMRDEELRSALRMSSRWGVVQPARSTGTGGLWQTESGLPVYVW